MVYLIIDCEIISLFIDISKQNLFDKLAYFFMIYIISNFKDNLKTT